MKMCLIHCSTHVGVFSLMSWCLALPTPRRPSPCAHMILFTHTLKASSGVPTSAPLGANDEFEPHPECLLPLSVGLPGHLHDLLAEFRHGRA